MKGLVRDSSDPPSTKPRPRARQWAFALLAIITAALIWTSRRITTTVKEQEHERKHDPFHWKRCSPDSDEHYRCGYLTVPMDWTNRSDPRTVDIATTLYQPVPGRKTERTLIIEPGGPGGSGTKMLWEKGKRFGDMYTGGQLDVLGFDPRGVNLSSPSISCFPKDAYRDRWTWTAFSWPETAGERAIDIVDALNEATMRGCRERHGDLPRFLTTAFVARDVDAIRQALGEEVLTAFMVSYGSGIGQTYAQMFPDRVGSVALDGMEFVVDGQTPWDWALTSLDNVTDAFEVGFIGECVRAGSKGCALSTMDESDEADHDHDYDYETAREDLSSRLHGIFDRIRRRPIPGVSRQGPGIVTYETLVEWLYSTMYDPGKWKDAAELLATLEKGNATLALDAIHHLSRWTYDPDAPPMRETKPHPQYADRSPQSLELGDMVLCGDSYDAERKSLDWWKETHARAAEQSWIAGSARIWNVIPCRWFDWTPAEVYRGGFNHTLRSPLMLIGSPYDPATPLRNARRLAAEMGDNARLVVHHGYGHSSSRDPSTCTNALIQAYILDGTVPEAAESDCYADRKPFDLSA